MPLTSLQHLYLAHVQDLYDAEHQLMHALPRIIDGTSHGQLREVFAHHYEQTCAQARRLEEIGRRLNCDVRGKRCKGMEGLLRESEDILGNPGDPDVIDAALIATIQRVAHYEIAAYGCARAYAAALGRDDDARTLQTTLDEEAHADKRLTQLAEDKIGGVRIHDALRVGK